MTDYLAENGRRIKIIGQLSVNDSVQFLGLSDQALVTGMPFIYNLWALSEPTGWVSANNSDQNWGISMFDANRLTNVAWVASVNSRTAYLPRSPVNPRATWILVCDDFLSHMRQEGLRLYYNWRNPLVNTQVYRRDNFRDGPVTNIFCFQNYRCYCE